MFETDIVHLENHISWLNATVSIHGTTAKTKEDEADRSSGFIPWENEVSYPFMMDPTMIPPSDSPTTVMPRYLIRSIRKRSFLAVHRHLRGHTQAENDRNYIHRYSRICHTAHRWSLEHRYIVKVWTDMLDRSPYSLTTLGMVVMLPSAPSSSMVITTGIGCFRNWWESTIKTQSFMSY